MLEEVEKEQLTGGEWSPNTFFFSISSVEKVNIKNSILKCKLIGFELELNIKAGIMFLKKHFCSFL